MNIGICVPNLFLFFFFLFSALLCDVQRCFGLWQSDTNSDSSASIVVNGSFESGPDPGSYLPLNPGSTAIPGWTVTRGQIDYVGIWQDFDGSRSIDLDGSPGFGGIAQTLPTTPGVRYRVNFALAGNPHGPPEPKLLQVTAAGQSAIFAFNATATTYENMAWERREWQFTATGTTATLEFFTRDTINGYFGPALDSVSVHPIAAAVDSSVLALWRFDEGSGSILHDASPYHNDGEIRNAAWVPGAFGTGLHFDGRTSYVIIPNSASLKPAGNFVIDAWFSLDTLQFDFAPPPDAGHGVILSNLGPYPFGGGYQFHLQSGARFQYAYRVGNPISNFSGFTDVPSAHQFYHAEVFYLRRLVGADSVTVVKTYLNDVLTDSAVFSQPLHYANTPFFYIGTNIDGRAVGSFGVRDFPGVIDEVRILSIDPGLPIPPPTPQPSDSSRVVIALRISDAGRADTLTFGVDPAATYCIDPGLGELELPPTPPVGVFDARFLSPTNDAGGCFGLGLGLDLRRSVSPSQVDTYRVKFQPSMAGYPFTFSWPELLPHYVGPVTLVDRFGGATVHVNMKNQSSFTLSNPLIRELLIIAGGPADSVNVGDSTTYRTFSQNDYAQRAHLLRSGMTPTAANVRDETFMRMGWFNEGLYVGIPKPDSTLQYGWVYFRRNVVRLPRFLPHSGPARGFDFYIGAKPWHYSRANPAVKYHDNHLAGEQYVLKFNVGASDVGITPPGFGDLVFADTALPLNPFNGMTIRQLISHTDSVLTFCRRYPAGYFLELDACLSRINAAFVGPITAFTTAPLTIGGARPLSDAPFLHSNPSARPAVLPQAARAPGESEPAEYALYQNYPNPFNPVTAIDFWIVTPGSVSLRIFNPLGQEVAPLFRDARLDQGRHSVEFDGGGLPSGVYYYRLDLAPDGATGRILTQVKKMVLMK